MVDEITLREETKSWEKDFAIYGGVRTPLEKRAMFIIREYYNKLENERI